MEAFSSHRDGTLTIIKENNPSSFEVEQTVQTMPGAKTCTLDTKNNHIILIALERTPLPSPSPAATASPSPGGESRSGRNQGPGILHILVVGR